MRWNGWMLWMAFLAAVVAGCGGSEEGDSSSSDAAPAASNQTTVATGQSVVAKTPGPADAVIEFLEAVRIGNDDKAAGMFTPLAREKVSKLGIQIAPRGSDTASFEVGDVEYMADNGARVAATWTDLGHNGVPQTDEMTWMVRRVSEGWRVAGMATVVFEGEPPLLLDFEKPDETLRKLDLLRQEVRRRTQRGSLQAQQPENSAGPIRR